MDESDEVVDESKVTKSYKKSFVKIIIIKVGTRKNTFHDRYLKKKKNIITKKHYLIQINNRFHDT